ncbi:MAG: cytochrome P450 [Candidatus Sericytochromatia bacterium]
MKAIEGVIPEGYNGIKGFFESIKKSQDSQLDWYYETWKKYGDYAKIIGMPNYDVFIISDPDGVEHILKTNHQNYKKPDFFNNSVGLLAGKGLIVNEGEQWLKNRRIMQPLFRKDSLNSFFDIMKACTLELISKLEQKTEAFDIVKEMYDIVIKIAGLTLLSSDLSSEASELGKNYREAFDFLSYKLRNPLSLPTWFPTEKNHRFHDAKKFIDNIISNIIEEHKNNNRKEVKDIISLLLNAKDPQTGEKLTEKEVKDEAITLLTAGHETTACALSWLWYLLGLNTDKQEKLYQEIGNLDILNCNLEDIQKIKYSKMVFDETLRLYPPAYSMPREAINDDIIKGYLIPKKSVIIVSCYTVHRREDLWEKPEEFYPEHFIEEAVEKRHKFAFFPFSGGPRVCIGANFAYMETQIIISMLAKKFRFELEPNQKIEADTTFSLKPKNPIYVKAYKR